MPVATERSVELDRVRRLTDSLFAEVHPAAFYDRGIPERHRALFYLGHLEAFDWNQVGRASLGLPPVSEALDTLFAFGIDPPPGQLPDDRPEDWPTVAQTVEYAKRVRTALDAVLERASPDSVSMAVEHRLMHAETFAYILHNLSPDRRVAAAPAVAVDEVAAPEPRMVDIPAGVAMLGRAQGSGFGWDNEFEAHAEEVPAFSIGKYKVTNAEYRAFVEDGGPVPHYWTRGTAGWAYRAFAGDMPLPLAWPVYVSHDQATAYARWAGKRLPSEAQFQRAAFGMPGGGQRMHPWGDRAPDPGVSGNFDFHRRDPVPVSATPGGDSAFGVSQLVGNGWEWTRSVFAPFPGFAPAPSYPGYSANFFDGDHYVLKGASPVTDRALLRPTFRNWFRRHYPYAYTTFRLVEE
jgi:formylglycine-generating enzyme required for sulfatase activity